MIKKAMITVLIIVSAIVGVLALLQRFSAAAPADPIEVREGVVSKIKTMAQLCTVDLYSEVPVLDTINSKVIFGIQKQRGAISFDLEKMQIDAEGDTVKITLPPEIIELYEAAEPNSWQVVDTKAIGPLSALRTDRISDAEENALKAKIQEKSRRRLYRNGTISRARAEGAENLSSLMEKIYRKPVVVTDPTPRGAHYDKYR